MRSPSSEPCFSRSVIISSSACVGCSCAPSPALITFAFTTRVKKCGAPDAECLITTISIFIASILRAVSFSVSPLLTLLPDAAKFTTSAERRRSASSNEILVRVELSKNKFTIVFPCNGGTFLIGLSRTSLNDIAVSRMSVISSLLIPSNPSK